MKATTYKELKKWINEGVDLAELAQAYADKVPSVDREQFEAVTQEIFNVLEGVSLMPVSYTHLTLPTSCVQCRSRWSPYH